jgi:predicted metal-dependent peptidase
VFEPDLLGTHDVDGVVYFTDGDGPAPKEAPLVPTLWILTKPREFDCAFGQRAFLRPPRSS